MKTIVTIMAFLTMSACSFKQRSELQFASYVRINNVEGMRECTGVIQTYLGFNTYKVGKVYCYWKPDPNDAGPVIEVGKPLEDRIVFESDLLTYYRANYRSFAMNIPAFIPLEMEWESQEQKEQKALGHQHGEYYLDQRYVRIDKKFIPVNADGDLLYGDDAAEVEAKLISKVQEVKAKMNADLDREFRKAFPHLVKTKMDNI